MISIPTVADESLLPVYAHPGDAGADLRSSVYTTIEPGCRALVPTGVRVQLPEGHMLEVRPRSGLAVKHGITVLNTPGTVDAGYRGEVGVVLFNTSDEAFFVSPGDRIAQAVITRFVQATFEPVQSLDSSARGESGFGSTGV